MLSAEVIMIISSVFVTLGTAAAMIIVSKLVQIRPAQAGLAATLTPSLVVGDIFVPSPWSNSGDVPTATYTATPILTTTAVPSTTVTATPATTTRPTVTTTPIVDETTIVVATGMIDGEIDLELNFSQDGSDYDDRVHDNEVATQALDNLGKGGKNQKNK
jgi:hypothetical protein